MYAKIKLVHPKMVKYLKKYIYIHGLNRAYLKLSILGGFKSLKLHPFESGKTSLCVLTITLGSTGEGQVSKWPGATLNFIHC